MLPHGIMAFQAGKMALRQAIALAVLGVLWGSEWIATATLAGRVPVLKAAAIRFAIAAVILFLLALFRRVKLPGRRALLAGLTLSATLITLPLLLLDWASRSVSSGTTAVLLASAPLFTALISLALKGPRASRRAMHAMLAGWGGIALAMWSARQVSWGACGLVLLAVLLTAFSLVHARRELANEPPLASAAVVITAAAALLALASVIFERGQSMKFDAGAAEALGYLSLIAGAAGFLLFFWLLREIESYQAAVVIWIQFLAAAIEAALFWRQIPSPIVIVGLLITAGCLWLTMSAKDDDELLMLRGVRGA